MRLFPEGHLSNEAGVRQALGFFMHRFFRENLPEGAVSQNGVFYRCGDIQGDAQFMFAFRELSGEDYLAESRRVLDGYLQTGVGVLEEHVDFENGVAGFSYRVPSEVGVPNG